MNIVMFYREYRLVSEKKEAKKRKEKKRNQGTLNDLMIQIY